MCGDMRYALDEDPLTVYVCHCTDCQTLTGASFSLSMIVRREALRLLRGEPREASVTLDDGRVKSARYCPRCITKLFGPSRVPGLCLVAPGTLDDTSWLSPAGHIWTRSAQPWVPIPEDTISISHRPSEAESLELVRIWRSRER